MNRLRFTALIAGLFSSACDSPEANRTRGGGPGADTGNRGEIVRMHEGAEPYAGTPRLIDGKPASIEPSLHADTLSRK